MLQPRFTFVAFISLLAVLFQIPDLAEINLNLYNFIRVTFGFAGFGYAIFLSTLVVIIFYTLSAFLGQKYRNHPSWAQPLYSIPLVHPCVDKALSKLLSAIVEHSIVPYYSFIASNDNFKIDFTRYLRVVILTLFSRLSEVNLLAFLNGPILEVYYAHLKCFMIVMNDHGLPDESNDEDLLLFQNRVLNCLATRHWATKSENDEVIYFQSMASEILPFLLPSQIKNGIVMQSFLRESLAFLILKSSFKSLASPHIINNLIVDLLHTSPNRPDPVQLQHVPLLEENFQYRSDSSFNFIIEDVLKTETGNLALRAFMSQSNCLNILNFLQDYSNLESTSTFELYLKYIQQDHAGDTLPLPKIIYQNIKDEIRKSFEIGEAPSGRILLPAYTYCQEILDSVIYPEFIQSHFFFESLCFHRKTKQESTLKKFSKHDLRDVFLGYGPPVKSSPSSLSVEEIEEEDNGYVVVDSSCDITEPLVFKNDWCSIKQQPLAFDSFSTSSITSNSAITSNTTLDAIPQVMIDEQRIHHGVELKNQNLLNPIDLINFAALEVKIVSAFTVPAVKTFVVYVVHIGLVDSGKKEEWNVHKRYSEFRQLYRDLKKFSPLNLGPFPSQVDLRNATDKNFVTSRLQSLDSFLQKTLKNESLKGLPIVKNFLRPGGVSYSCEKLIVDLGAIQSGDGNLKGQQTQANINADIKIKSDIVIDSIDDIDLNCQSRYDTLSECLTRSHLDDFSIGIPLHAGLNIDTDYENYSQSRRYLDDSNIDLSLQTGFVKDNNDLSIFPENGQSTNNPREGKSFDTIDNGNVGRDAHAMEKDLLAETFNLVVTAEKTDCLKGDPGKLVPEHLVSSLDEEKGGSRAITSEFHHDISNHKTSNFTTESDGHCLGNKNENDFHDERDDLTSFCEPGSDRIYRRERFSRRRPRRRASRTESIIKNFSEMEKQQKENRVNSSLHCNVTEIACFLSEINHHKGKEMTVPASCNGGFSLALLKILEFSFPSIWSIYWIRHSLLLIQMLLGPLIDNLIIMLLWQKIEVSLKPQYAERSIEVIHNLLYPSDSKSSDHPKEDLRNSKRAACESLKNKIPSPMRILLDGKNCEEGISNLIEMLQYPLINKHLIFSICDILVEALFPEIGPNR